MRIIIKRCGAVLAAICMLLLSACTGADALEAAMEKTSLAQSVDCDMRVEMEILGQSMNMSIAMTIFNDPLKYRMVLDMPSVGLSKAVMYMQRSGDKLILTTDASGEVVTEEISINDESYQQIQQSNAAEQLKQYMGMTKSFARKGSETFNGVECGVYEAVLDGAKLGDTLLESSAAASLETLGLDQETIAALYSNLPDTTAKYYVDENAKTIAGFSVDMTETMQHVGETIAQLSPEFAGASGNIYGKYVITMKFSNFNSAADFTIPVA